MRALVLLGLLMSFSTVTMAKTIHHHHHVNHVKHVHHHYHTKHHYGHKHHRRHSNQAIIMVQPQGGVIIAGSHHSKHRHGLQSVVFGIGF